jgi:hypothetical protein
MLISWLENVKGWYMHRMEYNIKSYILWNWGERIWNGISDLGQGLISGAYEHSNARSGAVDYRPDLGNVDKRKFLTLPGLEL